MTDIEFRVHSTVELVDWMPKDDDITGDDRIVQAARVSTGTDLTALGDNPMNRGLLRMLMRDRHGSPFEHVVFTFRIETPVFVAREFQRHRIASYNESSTRYREIGPVFYLPTRARPLVQAGKPGAYDFQVGSDEQWELVVEAHESIAGCAWNDYQQMLRAGVAREVARNILPLSFFTQFYVTMNLRSLFNFLSLRVAHESNAHPSFPLFEIQEVATKMEILASPVASYAMERFTEHGRIQP